MSPLNNELYQAYLLGKLPEEQAEEVERWLEDKSQRGEETVDQLALAKDTLLMGLRRSPRQDPVLAEPELDSVLHRIVALGPELLSSDRIEHANEPIETIGAYQLLEKLGEGGMGTVYKALHTRLKKVVALKVLAIDRLRNPESIKRFEREMEAAGRLDHPHLVRAMDAGELDGRHFLVMEYIEGVDLSQLSRSIGPLPVPEACELIRQAALGLQDAYEHGLVHRDVKPSNLFLAKSRNQPPIVKVLDLGLALLSDTTSADGEELTSAGQIMGTVDYMAPEQGGDTHNVDIRADVYSLGATLYKLLTSESLYHGEAYRTSIQKLTALVSQPVPPIEGRRSGIPPELAKIVHQMLDKDPRNRPATPQEVAVALAPFAAEANLRRLLDFAVPELENSDGSASTGGSLRMSADTVTIPPSFSPEPTPQAGVSKNGSGNRGNAVRLWLTLGGFAAALCLGLILLRIQTDHGTLIVEVAAEAASEIETRLEAGGLEVVDKKNNRTWSIQAFSQTDGQPSQRLPSGEYEVQTGSGLRVSDASGARLDTSSFELRRGDQLRLRVSLEPAALDASSKSEDARLANVASPQMAEDTELNSARPPLTDQQLQSLDLKGMTSLRVDAATLSKAGWGKLAQGLDLESLDIVVEQDSGSTLTDEQLNRITALPKLHRLVIPAQNMTKENGPILARAKQLRVLVLTGTSREDFTEEQALVLWSLSNLESINWRFVTPKLLALQTLSGLPFLTHLGAEGCSLGDAHFEEIAKFPQLRELQLNASGITPLGVERLTSMAPKLTLTGDIPVSDFAAEREVAEWLLEIPANQFSMAICLRSTFETLRLKADDSLPDEPFFVTEIRIDAGKAPQGDWSPLGRLRSLSKLYLFGIREFNDASLIRLNGIRDSIQTLELNYTSVRGLGFKALAGAPKLHRLICNRSFRMDDSVMPWIATLPRLEVLSLLEAKITDAGLRELAKGAPQLNYLILPRRTEITDDGLAALATMSLLTSVDLPPQITVDGVRHLLKMPQLQHVKLTLKQCTPEVLEVLAKLPNLHKLTIAPNTGALFTAGHLDTVAKLPHLRMLSLEPSIELAIAERLHELPQVYELRFGATNLTSEYMAGIAKMPKLKLLDVRHSSISELDWEQFKTARPDVDIHDARVVPDTSQKDGEPPETPVSSDPKED